MTELNIDAIQRKAQEVNPNVRIEQFVNSWNNELRIIARPEGVDVLLGRIRLVGGLTQKQAEKAVVHDLEQRRDAFHQSLEDVESCLTPDERKLFARVLRAYSKGGGTMDDLISFLALLSR